MNKEAQDRDNPKWLGDGLIVAICSALGYLLAFIHEIGYSSHFGIPIGFIHISITSILISIIIIIHFSNFLYMIIPNKTSPVVRSLLRIALSIGLLFTVTLYMYRGIWKEWLWYGLFMIFCVLLEFVLPLFTQRGKGSFTEKLILQEKIEHKTKSLFDLITTSKSGRVILRYIYLLFILLFVSYHSGRSSAIKQEYFLVPDNSENTVVLRIYEDVLVCSEFDRNNRETRNNFIIRSINDGQEIKLNLEKIGPLKKSKSAR